MNGGRLGTVFLNRYPGIPLPSTFLRGRKAGLLISFRTLLTRHVSLPSSFEQVKPAAALPAAKQPLQITAGNASGSSNQRKSQPNQGGASRNGGRFPRRQQAYVLNEEEEDDAAEDFHDED